MISRRARGVVRVVQTWDLHGGATRARALLEACEIVERLADTPMMGSDLSVALRATGACDSSVEWVEERHDRTMPELWYECPQGNWLLSFALRVSSSRALLVAACDVLSTLPFSDRTAIETARRWTRGECEAGEVVRKISEAIYAAALARSAEITRAQRPSLASA
jgi:hypothetical protein